MIQFAYQGPTLAPQASRLLTSPLTYLPTRSPTSGQSPPSTTVRRHKTRTALHVVVEPMPGSSCELALATAGVAHESAFSLSGPVARSSRRSAVRGNAASCARKIGDADIEAALDIIFPPTLPPLICPDMVGAARPSFPSSFR